MQLHKHPQSITSIAGMRLEMGAVLQKEDVYASTTGTWKVCPCPELSLGATTTIWVRPHAKLSENAQLLLGYLNPRDDDFYRCVAEHNGAYYVIPSPTWNWDGRLELKSVNHPECLQELMDYGYLVRDEHPVLNWQSDYSTRWEGHKNDVYTLTEKGKRESTRLLT